MAVVMLFVWLLALGAGFANACLVQEDHARHGHLSHQDADFTAMPVTALDVMAVDHTSAQVHPDAIDHDTSADRAVCQNFCADEQTGVVNPKVDVSAHLDVALVLASIWWEVPSLADHAPLKPALGELTWAEPPVFIRFLRLTI